MTASRQRPPNPGLPGRRHPLDQPFAAERIRVPLSFTLSASEYQRLTLGEIAEQGDPWDITFCEPWLLAIAPSQRTCWYAIRVEPCAEHYEVVAAFANGRLAAQGQEGSPVWMQRTALAMESIILSVVDRHGSRLALVMEKLQVLNGLLNQERSTAQAVSAVIGNAQPDPRLLLGAIVGDYIGSAYEALGEKRADAAFFTPHSRYTDDTVMTCAVAEALYLGRDFAPSLRRWGRRHPHRGYGESFERWLVDDSAPAYGSAGNGAAMRVAAIGLFCGTLEGVLATARSSAQCSHNHAEGIQGAQAVALAVWLARHQTSKQVIRDNIIERIGYPMERSLAEIRPHYGWSGLCRDSVPEAIQCFLEADDFAHTLRNVLSLGGDTDTMGAMAGAIAAAFWGGVPMELAQRVVAKLPCDIVETVNHFSASCPAPSAATPSPRQSAWH